MDDITGAEGEIRPDYADGKVETVYRHPETGEVLMTISLDPETAREMAAGLTQVSWLVDEHNHG